MKRRRCLLLILTFAAVLAIVLYAARYHVLPLVPRLLDVGRPPQPADYVMVLNGNVNVRPIVAAALFDAGWASGVVVASVKPSPSVGDGIVPPQQELCRRVLIHRGVPDRDIVIIDAQAETTFDEGKALAHFLESSPRTRVLVVTDGYHTRRSRLAFDHALGDRIEQVSFHSAPPTSFDPELWWQTRSGFLAIGGECLKLAFYSVRYGRWGYVAASLGVVAVLLVVVVRWRRC